MSGRIVYHEKGKDPLYKIWHSSDEHLFMYIHSGSGCIVSEEKIFPIEKGLLVFIAANKYHYTVPDNPAVYERSKFIFPIDTLNKIKDAFENKSATPKIINSSIVCAAIPKTETYTVEQIFNEYNGHNFGGNRELLFLSCFFKLAFLIDKYAVESVPTACGTISKAVKFINEKIAEDITIDDICSAVNISKHHFCRKFKEYMGLTVMKYILRTRIILAKSDLLKTDLPISEISKKNGFSSLSYFCRIFKEAENCSPLQFRKIKKY